MGPAEWPARCDALPPHTLANRGVSRHRGPAPGAVTPPPPRAVRVGHGALTTDRHAGWRGRAAAPTMTGPDRTGPDRAGSTSHLPSPTQTQAGGRTAPTTT